MKSLYEILGVAKDATATEIKKAFRRRSQETHPDKHNGDASKNDEFAEVNKAKMILLDPVRRKHYDETGEVTNNGQREPSDQEKAKSYILGLVMQAVQQNVDIEHTDIMRALNRFIEQDQQQTSANLQKINRKSEEMDKMAHRFKSKSDGEENFITMALEHEARKVKRECANMESRLAMIAAAKEILEDFVYEFTSRPSGGMFSSTSTVADSYKNLGGWA